MPPQNSAKPARLPSFSVEPNQHSISGLSSGAFMTVQLHLAHSSQFVGAGIIAGGPYRCVESLRDISLVVEDSYELNALTICMSPLTKATGPNAGTLAERAKHTPHIDPIENLATHRLYIFTGTEDSVVSPIVVKATLDFYKILGVPNQNIKFVDNIPAGHAIITQNPDDSPLNANRPPYINQGDFIQSHDILNQIYPGLKPAAQHASGTLIRFDQSEFLPEKTGPYASMGQFGYAYIPEAVSQGATARAVHIALHGCKQGASYVNFARGQPDITGQPPFGNRYITTTGYNEIAESNNIIVLYPQATGADDDDVQNPDGCWDWWGYTSSNAGKPDYYSKNAIQIRAIHGMLQRLCR